MREDVRGVGKPLDAPKDPSADLGNFSSLFGTSHNLMYKYNRIYQFSSMIERKFKGANNCSCGFAAKYTSRRFLNISVVEQSIMLGGKPFHILTRSTRRVQTLARRVHSESANFRQGYGSLPKFNGSLLAPSSISPENFIEIHS